MLTEQGLPVGIFLLNSASLKQSGKRLNRAVAAKPGRITGLLDRRRVAADRVARLGAELDEARSVTSPDAKLVGQLEADLRHANATEARIIAEDSLESERGLSGDPNKVADAQKRFSEAQRLERQAEHAAKRVIPLQNAEERLGELERQIAAESDEAARGKLELERAEAQRKVDDLSTKVSRGEADEIRRNSRASIAELSDEIAELQAERKKLAKTDSPDKATLEEFDRKIARRERALQRAGQSARTRELAVLRDRQTSIAEELADIDSKMASGPAADALEKLESRKAALIADRKSIAITESVLEERIGSSELRRRISLYEEFQGGWSSELDELKSKTGLSSEDLARKAILEGRLSSVDLADLKKQLRGRDFRFTARLNEAKDAAARLLRDSRMRLTGLRDPNSLLHTRLDGRFKAAAERPMLTAFAVGGAAEGLLAALESDVSDEARHTFAPSLIGAFGLDLKEWDALSFETRNGGEALARTADATSAFGNVGMIVGGIKLGQLGGTRLGASRGGQGAGRFLTRVVPRHGIVAASAGRATGAGGFVLRGLAGPVGQGAIGGGIAYFKYSDPSQLENSDLKTFAELSVELGISGGRRLCRSWASRSCYCGRSDRYRSGCGLFHRDWQDPGSWRGRQTSRYVLRFD